MQKNARGLGRDFFPTATDTRSVAFPKVARVLIFSLSFFYYVPTILSESLAQAKKGSTVKPLPSGQLWSLP